VHPDKKLKKDVENNKINRVLLLDNIITKAVKTGDVFGKNF
jgi:hypothetical protein